MAEESSALEPWKAFSRVLFGDWHDFNPARSLYLDFEGSGAREDILTLYWPQKAEDQRVSYIVRRQNETALDVDELKRACDKLRVELDRVSHIVVFSPGPEIPAEFLRFQSAFDIELDSENWINLHLTTRKCPRMKRAIRDRAFVWRTGNTKIEYSLEALEQAFEITRPKQLRSNSKSYSDGTEGTFSPLKLSRHWVDGSISDEDLLLLKSYCRFDVESMFKIAGKCEELRG